ncbi:MAG: DUF3775 domain-containing protein, partial [Alphaproteobacteria bacterium]|nr:DUF3775 domain-containing protein [Alphaproteobacteria bacterium]
MLDISLSKLAYLVIKARAFDAKVAPLVPEPGSNPTDDDDRAVLEDLPGDATEGELADALASLNQDELDEVLALAWLGRGDFAKEEWTDALRQARERRGIGSVTRYLMELPLLGDYLEE